MDYKQIMYIATASDLPPAADDGQFAFARDSQLTYNYSANTSSWLPLGRQMVFKSSVQINAKNLGNILIYTLPQTPLFFYPTGIVMRAVNVSGTGTNPVITIGTNSPNYNNIATSSLVAGLLGALDVNNGAPLMATFSPALAGGAAVYVRVNGAALLYSNYIIKIDLLGYYDSTQP